MAINSKDPNKSLQILRESNVYFEKFISSKNNYKTLNTQNGEERAISPCGVVAVCVAAVAVAGYNYVVAVQAVAGFQVAYKAWALKSKITTYGSIKKDPLNATENPEEEMVKVMDLIYE